MKQVLVDIPCDNCGAPVRWSESDLLEHRERIRRGEHAACACDDDCAVHVDAWDEGNLDDILDTFVAARAEVTP